MGEKQKKPKFDIGRYDLVTDFCLADKIVCDKPCWLYSVIFCGLGDATNAWYLRDGMSTAGEIKALGITVAYTMVPVVFEHPIRFKKGLFVDFVTNGYSVFVQYRPDY